MLSKRLSLSPYTARAWPLPVDHINCLCLTLDLTATYFSGCHLYLHLALDCCMVSLTQLIDCYVASLFLRAFEITFFFNLLFGRMLKDFGSFLEDQLFFSTTGNTHQIQVFLSTPLTMREKRKLWLYRWNAHSISDFLFRAHGSRMR